MSVSSNNHATDTFNALARAAISISSGQGMGFYEDEGNYADGTLCDYATQGMTGGITQFSPRQYDWGEGYYKMMLNKYSENSVEVKVEYWIED